MSLTKKQAISLVLDLYKQLGEHGWAEDYIEGFTCINDPDNISRAISLAMDNDGKSLIEYLDSTTWDEEYNINYDDGGLLSFATEVAAILRKYRLLDEETKKARALATTITTLSYTVLCPNCIKLSRHGEKPPFDTTCSYCGTEIHVEPMIKPTPTPTGARPL